METTCHYLLYCPYFINERKFLLDDVSDPLPSCETAFVKFLLYGDDSFIEYNLSSKRFDGPLLKIFLMLFFVKL